MERTQREIRGPRALLALLLLTTCCTAAPIARAAMGEIIPAVGITRAVDTDNDEVKAFGSLAFRAHMFKVLRPEIGIAYRSESRFDDQLRVRQWPVTASLWFAPVDVIYAGAGVGWYQTTFDYDQDKIAFPIEDETRQDFGVHLGGGLQVPLGPVAGLDLHGRYVMMRDQDSHLVPEKFDPDFWQTSLGIAIKF